MSIALSEDVRALVRGANFAHLATRKYTGQPFPTRENPAQRVVLVIEADKVRFVRLPFVHAPGRP